MRFLGASATDVGHSRKVNQDAIILKIASFDNEGFYDIHGENREFAVLAVCDGIGGLEHGEISSGIVKNGIDEWCDGILRWMNIRTIDPDMLFSHLKDAADEWNNRVMDFAADSGSATGTTMSLLMLISDNYYVLQVGDSRIYRLNNQSVEQLTIDASVVRFREGKSKTFLDNFMGKSSDLTFTSSSGLLSEGDVFVVCSDGFYHRFREQDAVSFMEAESEGLIQETCERLIGEMISRGEKDNISVGAIRVLR